jgi:hypothetical protein
MKTLKRKVYGLISICEEHGLDVPSKFFPSIDLRGKRKLARIDSATNDQQPTITEAPESSQLIDLPSYDWSQEFVVADAEAAECLRLVGAVATGDIIGVSECDIVDAGIEAAHVAA